MHELRQSSNIREKHDCTNLQGVLCAYLSEANLPACHVRIECSCVLFSPCKMRVSETRAKRFLSFTSRAAVSHGNSSTMRPRPHPSMSGSRMLAVPETKRKDGSSRQKRNSSRHAVLAEILSEIDPTRKKHVLQSVDLTRFTRMTRDCMASIARACWPERRNPTGRPT